MKLKRTMSLLLAICLLVGILPVMNFQTASAAQSQPTALTVTDYSSWATDENGLQYKLESSTLKVLFRSQEELEKGMEFYKTKQAQIGGKNVTYYAVWFCVPDGVSVELGGTVTIPETEVPFTIRAHRAWSDYDYFNIESYGYVGGWRYTGQVDVLGKLSLADETKVVSNAKLPETSRLTKGAIAKTNSDGVATWSEPDASSIRAKIFLQANQDEMTGLEFTVNNDCALGVYYADNFWYDYAASRSYFTAGGPRSTSDVKQAWYNKLDVKTGGWFDSNYGVQAAESVSMPNLMGENTRVEMFKEHWPQTLTLPDNCVFKLHTSSITGDVVNNNSFKSYVYGWYKVPVYNHEVRVSISGGVTNNVGSLSVYGTCEKDLINKGTSVDLTGTVRGNVIDSGTGRPETYRYVYEDGHESLSYSPNPTVQVNGDVWGNVTVNPCTNPLKPDSVSGRYTYKYDVNYVFVTGYVGASQYFGNDSQYDFSGVNRDIAGGHVTIGEHSIGKIGGAVYMVDNAGYATLCGEVVQAISHGPSLTLSSGTIGGYYHEDWRRKAGYVDASTGTLTIEGYIFEAGQLPQAEKGFTSEACVFLYDPDGGSTFHVESGQKINDSGSIFWLPVVNDGVFNCQQASVYFNSSSGGSRTFSTTFNKSLENNGDASFQKIVANDLFTNNGTIRALKNSELHLGLLNTSVITELSGTLVTDDNPNGVSDVGYLGSNDGVLINQRGATIVNLGLASNWSAVRTNKTGYGVINRGVVSNLDGTYVDVYGDNAEAAFYTAPGSVTMNIGSNAYNVTGMGEYSAVIPFDEYGYYAGEEDWDDEDWDFFETMFNSSSGVNDNEFMTDGGYKTSDFWTIDWSFVPNYQQLMADGDDQHRALPNKSSYNYVETRFTDTWTDPRFSKFVRESGQAYTLFDKLYAQVFYMSSPAWDMADYGPYYPYYWDIRTDKEHATKTTYESSDKNKENPLYWRSVNTTMFIGKDPVYEIPAMLADLEAEHILNGGTRSNFGGRYNYHLSGLKRSMGLIDTNNSFCNYENREAITNRSVWLVSRNATVDPFNLVKSATGKTISLLSDLETVCWEVPKSGSSTIFNNPSYKVGKPDWAYKGFEPVGFRYKQDGHYEMKNGRRVWIDEVDELLPVNGDSSYTLNPAEKDTSALSYPGNKVFISEIKVDTAEPYDWFVTKTDADGNEYLGTRKNGNHLIGGVILNGVIGDNSYDTSARVAPDFLDGVTNQPPEVLEVGADYVIVNSYDWLREYENRAGIRHEFSIDKTNWVFDPVNKVKIGDVTTWRDSDLSLTYRGQKDSPDGFRISGLTPDTDYSVYSRAGVGLDNQHVSPSDPSPAATFHTKKVAEAPAVPVFVSRTATSITCEAIDGQIYSADNGKTWFAGKDGTVTITKLTKGTEYNIITKVLAHDDLGESPASEPLVAYTKGDPNESLVGPTVLSKTNTSITCAPREGYEFGFSKTANKKNITWKQSEVLTGLTTNTQYYIYVRKAETDEHLAGQISEPVACKTLATQSNPGAISVTGKTDTSFTVNVLSTQEYSLDGTKWQTFGDERQHKFTGFTAGETVTLRTRKLPTATATTSNPTSLNIKMLTKPAAPAAPVFVRATNHTIRVQAAYGQEFSINNGATWQTGVTFYDLMADQAYDIITRVKATTTGANNTNGNVASEPSKALRAYTLADAPLIPSVPQIKYYDDTTVTVIVPEGYEVRRDGSSWTTNGLFTNLNPDQNYSFYQRIKATDTSVASESSDATVVRTKIASTNVEVPAVPEIIDRNSNMLRVSKVDSLEYAIKRVGDETAELNYQNLGTFEDLESGVEYVIYVRTKETDTAMPSQPVSITGATLNAVPDAPAAPEMAYRSAYDIKVVVNEGEEVSIDGGKTWQDSGEFHDLKPATEYEIIKRTKSTENGDFSDATKAPASKPSEPLKISTMAEPVAKPAAPSFVSKTDNMILIDLPEGSEASMDNGKTWQQTGEFVGLNPNQEYQIVTRIAATEDTVAGAVSEALSVTTKKSVEQVDAPETAPTIESHTADSISLGLVPGMEYRLVGTDEWQTNPVFDNLEPGKEYTFVSRWAETDDARESKESPEAKFSTKSIPAAPNIPDLKYVSSTEIEIYTKTGLEYMIISGDYSSKWTTDGVFANLAPDKEYSIVARKTETETEVESELSQVLKVRTKAEAVYEIAAPVLLDKSDTSLTISLPDGWESQIDDGDWTETSVFEDLKPDSEHTIKIRIKATDSTMPSIESKPLVAVTKKPSKENVVPGVPEVETRTDVSIKIKSEEGLEYSIDGGQTWNKTGEFNGLVPGENYEIIARTSENEEFMPSAPSRALKVSTKNVFKPEEEPKPEFGADNVIMTSGTSFRVNVDEKYEVSIDSGETWTQDRDFGNLKPGETYDVVIRTHETDDNMPGPMSDVLHVKVSSRPAAVEKPEVFDKTDVSITIAIKPGDELSIDGGRTWTDRDTFEGLTPDTEYQIIERKKATTNTVAGEFSEVLIVRTKKVGPEWDDTVEFAEPIVGGTYIRSEAIDGYEFSIDHGQTWVTDPDFEDLKYSTEYDIMARKAGTDDMMPGEARDVFTVRTKARPAPSNPSEDDGGNYKDVQGDGEYIVEPWLFGDGERVRPYDSITRAEASALFYRVLGVGNDDVQISFKDVSPNAWYYKVVTAMGSSGVLSGYPDEMFRPNDKMTRSQFAMVLTRYKNTVKGPSSEKTLVDIDGHWAKAAIEKAVANGWIFGDPDGRFRPDAPVTRAEAVAMINRATGRRSIEIDESMKTGLKLWKDLNHPDAWFYDDILEAGVAHEESVVSGVCTWTKVSEVKADLNETVENTLNSIIALLP